jgi:hypothetical protein
VWEKKRMRWERPVACVGEKEDKMGETCTVCGRKRQVCLMGILKERDGSVELGLNGWIIMQ